MENKNIELIDASTQDEILVSVRQVGDLQALAISLRSDGDVEIFLSRSDYKLLVDSLSEWIGDTAGPV